MLHRLKEEADTELYIGRSLWGLRKLTSKLVWVHHHVKIFYPDKRKLGAI